MLQNVKLSIRTKILIGYFLVICCLGTSIIIVSDRISSLQDEIETIASRDLEIHNLITSIRYNAINMESSQRGFVITGDESYLTPYMNGLTEWEANYNVLARYLDGNPDFLAQLEDIKKNIENWIKVAGEPVIRYKKNNDNQKIIESFANDDGKAYIDQLRVKLENLRQAQIRLTGDRINELENKNNNLIVSLYAMLMLLSVIAFLIVSFVSGSIVNTIKQVVRTIKDIDSPGGDLTQRIQVATRDEIKDLADATNSLLDNVNSLNWIQTNSAEVATMSQGVNDMKTLASSFLSKLAPMLDAVYGQFYIREGKGEDQRLVKIGDYAASGDPVGNISFRLGEGLIGQAAVEKRPFLLHSAPDHPIRIQTGTGQVPPQSILIVPVEFEGKVTAVVEFASVGSFTAAHLKLLEQIESYFGVTINNVAGRMEVERLLSESQVLTEELQVQTEELQAQSEEMQMQQEEMRMTTEHLEEQNIYAEQKTRELEKAKAELEVYSEQLELSSQYKSNFLANMSHELRTPLNSILILSQILSENENKTLTAEEKGYAEVIHSSGSDLLMLIDDILDLSKIEAGKIVLTIDEVNVSEIPEHMKLGFVPVAEKKGLDFKLSVADSAPSVIYTDGHRLQQILKNLLSNAFKFTEKGSVALAVRKADPDSVKRYLPSHVNNDVLEIRVTDTGIGIPKEKQQLIFEAFQQVDGDTTRQYGGTGLGLSICSEFMKLLGGRILLDSEVQLGSTFTLLVPSLPHLQKEQLLLDRQEVAAASEAALSVPDASEPSTGALAPQEESEFACPLFKGKKVLLAEDDSRNVFALVKALESKEFIVTVAGNGKECLDILQKSTDFDLILMDIMMPVMDGYEAMKAIRRLPETADKPIIALTAKAMKNDRDKCLLAGASDYISKPIDMDQLFSLMRVWLTKQVGQ
ncbi:response regulator [Paenibacillus sp. N4]|uniref:CHASE3 domain-containing protein n=1 Tax=Paenibacillus vietnamensis TaxID=2590547 RepID=UPI001CD0D17D|nr:response regulator [Paenibacillus vietnamensis]MCA0756021.1 response regulator [Paenibacillus vietnamensis]